MFIKYLLQLKYCIDIPPPDILIDEVISSHQDVLVSQRVAYIVITVSLSESFIIIKEILLFYDVVIIFVVYKE